MKEVKQILAHGEMSNLVGKWAIIPTSDSKMRYKVFILGSAKKYYIVQVIGMIGPNVCKLVKPKKMKKWIICPTLEVFNFVCKEYEKENNLNCFTCDFLADVNNDNHKTDY